MLSILSNRIRMKLNRNFMKILDSCYTYYEFIMGKKIYDTDTIGDLVKPITMMTDFNFDSSILSISLKDFRNSKLQTVEVDDTTTEMLIYSLKSKYDLLSYNSGHNMMDASCKNFPWKLDFSDHYATDGNSSNPGEIIQFNENEKEIEIVRDDHNLMNLRHVVYPKYDPRQNHTESKTDVNEFNYERVSNNIYSKENIDNKYQIGISVNGNVVLHNEDTDMYFMIDSEELKESMAKDAASVYIDRNHAAVFTLDNKYFSIVNMPFELPIINEWNANLIENSQTITSYDDSVELRELFSHASIPNYLGMLQKIDNSEVISNLHTNGHRVFTDEEIYMARNELTRVVPSSHFASYEFTGEPCESTVFDKVIEYVMMPDGTMIINSCTGISSNSVKINDRIYTIIRNIDADTNYLAWTDDGKAWISLIELPDSINEIKAGMCDEYYIVFSDIGGYTWAYSIDLSKNTIA